MATCRDDDVIEARDVIGARDGNDDVTGARGGDSGTRGASGCTLEFSCLGNAVHTGNCHVNYSI